jgi:UDP-glucose 4-epimerase
VVAAADRIQAELGWTARLGLDDMIESAWQGWRHRHG